MYLCGLKIVLPKLKDMRIGNPKVIPSGNEVKPLNGDHLSENEIQVLMYMKDMKPHSDPPEGMGADVFGVVCEMLKERKYIKELKADFVVSFNEPACYCITAKGYEAVAMLEQVEKGKEVEEREKVKTEEKKLEEVITDDELSMLFAEVVKHHPCYRSTTWNTSFWNATKEYLKRLFCQGQSPLFVYSIANELSVKNTNSRNPLGDGSVDDGDSLAYKLYVVIYYKYKDNPAYSIMLDALAQQIGALAYKSRLEESQKRLDTVRMKYGVEQNKETKEDEGKAHREELKQQLDLQVKRNGELETEIKNLKEKLAAQQSGKDYYEDLQQALLTIDELKSELESLRQEDEMEDSPEEVELKIRIEVLNLLLREAGYDTKTIKEKRLNIKMTKLYHLILNKGTESLLKKCIGKVTYKRKPDGIDEKVKEINSLLGKINNDWKIQL